MSAESIAAQLLGPEGTVACQAVAQGAHLAKWIHRQGAIGSVIKRDMSPVTVADFAVQALIASRLSSAFPVLPIVAEEDAGDLVGELRDEVLALIRRFDPHTPVGPVAAWIERGRCTSASQFWTLDPIDGTREYLHDRQYVVALSLIEDGVVRLAVLGCPRLSFPYRMATTADDFRGDGGIAVAVAGRGAWWIEPFAETMTRLSVSSTADLGHARIVHSYERAHGCAADLDTFLRITGNTVARYALDSQVKHAIVAAGRADLLLRFPPDRSAREAIWDQAAGSLLIQEAGGRITDLDGRPLDFSTGRRLVRNNGVVASNGYLHDAALAALGMMRAEFRRAG